MDTQGSLTHIAAIFKFGDVSGPRAKKWPKVNCRLKEVKEALVATHHTFTTTYFDNMWDNMWVQWTQGKKMTQSKLQIKGSKGSIGGYPPHIYHHIFWQYVGQYAGPIFSWEKINEYFWYHLEIFLGVFYDNLCWLGRAAGAINANYLTF